VSAANSECRKGKKRMTKARNYGVEEISDVVTPGGMHPPGRLVLILDIGFFVRSVYPVGTVVDFLNNISHISV